MIKFAMILSMVFQSTLVWGQQRTKSVPPTGGIVNERVGQMESETKSMDLTLKAIRQQLSDISAKALGQGTPAYLSIGEAVVGTSFAALLFFVLKEYVFPIPPVSGCWTFETETVETSYNPYRGMKLKYIVLIWQEGNKIFGTGEKMSELVSSEYREYTGADRSQVKVQGYLTKRYVSRSRIVLHFEEHGLKRNSSTIHELRMRRKKTMEGVFTSTVANSLGPVKWTQGFGKSRFDGQDG